MTFHPRTLLTIVTEAALESDLVALFRAHKLRGWTIVEARGKGDHGVVQGTFDASANIQIEIIVETPIAEDLADKILQQFGQNYALIQWLSEVRVIRADKFK